MESTREQRDPAAHLTILSGDVGYAYATTDNAYHVVEGGNAGASAVLDGFTIAGGNADGSGVDARGAGLYLASGSPTLANLVFTANRASGYGGGMANSSGSPRLTDVVFRGNVALNRGGGLYNDAGAPALTRVTFLLGHRFEGAASSTGKAARTIADSLFEGRMCGTGHLHARAAAGRAP